MQKLGLNACVQTQTTCVVQVTKMGTRDSGTCDHKAEQRTNQLRGGDME